MSGTELPSTPRNAWIAGTIASIGVVCASASVVDAVKNIGQWEATGWIEKMATWSVVLATTTFAICAFTAFTGIGTSGDENERHRMKISTTMLGTLAMLATTTLGWHRAKGFEWSEQQGSALIAIVIALVLPAVARDRKAIRTYWTGKQLTNALNTLRSRDTQKPERRG